MEVFCNFLDDAVDKHLDRFAILNEVIVIQNKNKMLRDVFVGIINDGRYYRIQVDIILAELSQRRIG